LVQLVLTSYFIEAIAVCFITRLHSSCWSRLRSQQRLSQRLLTRTCYLLTLPWRRLATVRMTDAFRAK